MGGQWKSLIVRTKEPPLYQVNEIGFEKEAYKQGCGRVRNQSKVEKQKLKGFYWKTKQMVKKTERIRLKADGSERFGSGDEKVLSLK